MENRGPAGEGRPGRALIPRRRQGVLRLLGLHKKTHRATAEEIKTAYRREAMEGTRTSTREPTRKGGEDVQAAAEGVPGAG